MQAAAAAAPDTLTWCGHLDGYQATAYLCGRGGASDRWVKCLNCGREYSARWLAQFTGRDTSSSPRRPGPPSSLVTSPPAHEGAGTTGRTGSMNAPATGAPPSGAGTKAPANDRPAEDLGEGHIQGNLTEDPELRFTGTGRAVAKLRVAYTPRIHDTESGRWMDGETEFYTVNVWGGQAERCAEALLRGDRIVASGRWSKRFWQDREGLDREAVELTAQDVGASLLFRQAVVVRTQQRQGGGRSE